MWRMGLWRLGGTQVIFEGIPTYPDAGRFWQMIERHHVSTFYTAPTAIRSLIKLGGDLPRQFDLIFACGCWVRWVSRSILKRGCGITKKVGGGRCPIVDTWWQTETGSHMIAPLPGAVADQAGFLHVATAGHHGGYR
jgi:acetyl-CoA synthetase